MKTDVTIISTSINKSIISSYNDYKIIESDFNYNDLLIYKKVIFYNILNNKTSDEIEKIYKYCKDNNVLYINVTNNVESVLLTRYLICYDNNKIAIEGNTIDVLKNDKLLKRLGFKLPFYFELSLLLKDYGLLKDIFLDKESLKSQLWK